MGRSAAPVLTVRYSGSAHTFVAGNDVVIGRDIHAEKIEATGIDYRDKSSRSVHSSTTIPDDLARRIIASTADLGLVFAGWDFKVDDNGNYWCLEANPMPGYDAYDRRSGGQISQSLIKLLKSEPSVHN